MTVRTFHHILEARNGVLYDNKGNAIGTVAQGRGHAPPTPSFNMRSVEQPRTANTHGAKCGNCFALADEAVAFGIITPQARYDLALERDIG